MPANTIPANQPVSQQDDALRRARAADQNRQTRHALTALAATTPGRRARIRRYAEDYLSQIDRRRLPLGCCQPITCDRGNRVDAFRMRGGEQLARFLGLAVQSSDPHLPDTARAVIAALDGPTVAQLTDAAHRTGDPLGVATLYVITGTIPTGAAR
ncbi:hypothetical protein [Streptomyces sioyaensis]|uniref:hypothetical protein n=1 Tax=Streptomyces sioyaensis TaxID=67364 RepID=UPI003D714C99